MRAEVHRAFFLLIFFIAVYIAGFLVFLGYARSVEVESDVSQISHSGFEFKERDLLVVLTGGKDRIKFSLDLAEATGLPLLISGVNPAISSRDVFLENGLEAIAHLPKIYVGKLAANTKENAIEADICALVNGYDRVVVITSNYHILRSYTLFASTLHEDIKVEAMAIPAIDISTMALIKSPKSLLFVLKEYTKYIYLLAELLLEKYFKLLGV